MATTLIIPDIDLEKEKKSELTKLIERTIKTIYNHQGFYSALNFIIRAGLAPGNDMAKAEDYLTSVVGRCDDKA